MKTKNLFATALFAVGVCVNLASCSNDAVEAVSEDCAIRLTTQVEPATRGTNTDLQSTQIIAGRQIGVTITGAKSEHNNVVWTAGADGALTNTGDPVYYGDGTHYICAYHPYVEDSEFENGFGFNNYFTLSVSTDQSTEAEYLKSDWLFGSKTGVTKSTSPVELTFKHSMAKINVTLSDDSEVEDLSDAEVYICGTKNNARTTVSGLGSIMTYDDNFTSGETVEIKAGITTADAKSVSAIIIPQEVTSETKFIKVVLGDKSYYYTLKSDKNFWAGYSYSYTLKLKMTALSAESEQITPWTGNEEEEGDAEGV